MSELIKLAVGDIVTRDGSDRQLVIAIDEECYSGTFECVRAPDSGMVRCW